jgi:hypothetical protein
MFVGLTLITYVLMFTPNKYGHVPYYHTTKTLTPGIKVQLAALYSEGLKPLLPYDKGYGFVCYETKLKLTLLYM